MKKILMLFTLLFGITLSVDAAYWLCRVKRNVNFRECPSTECNKICMLPAGSYVLADFSSLDFDSDNSFVSAIYISKNIEGYVSAIYLEKEKQIDVDSNGVFQKVGTYSGYDPELSILNKTDLNITVKINDNRYAFKPNERRTITCAPGTVSIIASSPGVIPYVGNDVVENNGRYNWEFFIIKSYR